MDYQYVGVDHVSGQRQEVPVRCRDCFIYGKSGWPVKTATQLTLTQGEPIPVCTMPGIVEYHLDEIYELPPCRGALKLTSDKRPGINAGVLSSQAFLDSRIHAVIGEVLIVMSSLLVFCPDFLALL